MSVLSKTKRSLKEMIQDDHVKERFEMIMGKKASASFLLSVLNCAQGNSKLMEAEPDSILMASAVAGTLNLPIDPSLGQAYIIPYNVKEKNSQGIEIWKKKAQFQIGYKGLIQLSLRSNKFETMNVTDVREGEIEHIDRLTGKIQYNWNQDQDERKKLKIVGFVAYFSLVTGFSKSLFMTINELNVHGAKYSKTFNNSNGRWKIDFEAMAKKTVLKLLLDKFAPKTIEMTKAIKTDQSIVGDYDGNNLDFADNKTNEPIDIEKLNAEKEKNRVINHISISTSIEQLEQCFEAIPDEQVRSLYDEKLKSLKTN